MTYQLVFFTFFGWWRMSVAQSIKIIKIYSNIYTYLDCLYFLEFHCTSVSGERYITVRFSFGRRQISRDTDQVASEPWQANQFSLWRVSWRQSRGTFVWSRSRRWPLSSRGRRGFGRLVRWTPRWWPGSWVCSCRTCGRPSRRWTRKGWSGHQKGSRGFGRSNGTSCRGQWRMIQPWSSHQLRLDNGANHGLSLPVRRGHRESRMNPRLPIWHLASSPGCSVSPRTSFVVTQNFLDDHNSFSHRHCSTKRTAIWGGGHSCSSSLRPTRRQLSGSADVVVN